MHPARQILWSALTCRLRDTDVYLGLAASLDDVVSELVSANQMVAYPIQPILATKFDVVPTPLRMYAVRDSRLVEITPEPNGPAVLAEDGFQRVRLQLRLDRVDSARCEGVPSAAEAKADSGGSVVLATALTARPVMAFLLTVGLPVHEEDSFFNRVVHDFLAESWITVPNLLRQLGCSSAEQISEGDCNACET